MRRVLGAGFPGGKGFDGRSIVSQTGSNAMSPSNPATVGMEFDRVCFRPVGPTALDAGTNSLLGSPPIMSCAADPRASSALDGLLAGE